MKSIKIILKKNHKNKKQKSKKIKNHVFKDKNK